MQTAVSILGGLLIAYALFSFVRTTWRPADKIRQKAPKPSSEWNATGDDHQSDGGHGHGGSV